MNLLFQYFSLPLTPYGNCLPTLIFTFQLLMFSLLLLSSKFSKYLHSICYTIPLSKKNLFLISPIMKTSHQWLHFHHIKYQFFFQNLILNIQTNEQIGIYSSFVGSFLRKTINSYGKPVLQLFSSQSLKLIT